MPSTSLEQLKTSEEAAEQIAFADVILLNKTDLVSKDELTAIERTRAR
jgi:G3E family GTPase